MIDVKRECEKWDEERRRERRVDLSGGRKK